MGFFDWFSPPKLAPVVIIRNVLGKEIDRVEGVRDLWGKVDLRGRQWCHADLSGMWLDGSDLAGANLFGARCVGTSFARCNLKNANLDYARIEGSSFRQADLEGADLLYTDVSLANCYFASHRACNIVTCPLFMLFILNALLILASVAGELLFRP